MLHEYGDVYLVAMQWKHFREWDFIIIIIIIIITINIIKKPSLSDIFLFN